MLVTSVRDNVSDSFLGFQLCGSVKVAVRGFIDAVSGIDGLDSVIKLHPHDFDLWLLGSFDESTGQFNQDDMRCILRGLTAELIVKNDSYDDFISNPDSVVNEVISGA